MSGGPTAGRTGIAAVLVAMALVWGLVATGLVSSNDGSHVALARALALRGETPIDPDAHLTLWVDRARRGEHQYSDRPPGTAFLAIPAVRLGAALDPVLLRRSLERRDVIVSPAGVRYAQTHSVRARGQPPLLGLQGTALALKLHTVAVGVAGLWCLVALLRRLEVTRSACVYAIAAGGLATLWGPYSTMLFSHVTAASLIAAMLLLVALDREQPRWWVAALVGLAGGWAIAADYLLALAVVPLVALALPPRRWPWVAAGVAPIAALTAAYHHAAFGSVWAIGYDFHANFPFARARGSTFDGNPLTGLWTLWGLGRGAGVLAQAPVALAGIAAAAVDRRVRPWVLAFIPWALVLAMHHTPWGGAAEDHRYLIPALPLALVGLGLLWDRAPRLSVRVGLVGLTAVSAVLVWLHFLSWRG